MSRTTTPWCLLVLLVLSAVAASRAPGDTRPNIVLFFPDTIAAEAMGAQGHPVVQTPNFDAFAASATRFATAYSSYPQCSPSRTSLFTGRHPHTVGHRTMTHLLQAWEPNVFQMLKQNGYTTLHLGKNDVLGADAWNATYTYWQELSGVNQGPSPYTYPNAGYWSFEGTPGTGLGNGTAQNGDLTAVKRALQFMRLQDVPEPFAIFLPGIGAHPPYGAPKDFANMYKPAEIRAKAPLRPMNTTLKPAYIGQDGIRAFRNITSFNETWSYKIAADYFARVSYTDWVFGELLQGIDSVPGLTERTVVAFSSDHGDFFGNYGMPEKWSGAGDDLLLHVPLAIRVPGGTPGVVVNTPVQVLDLFATFLELGNVSSWLVSPTITSATANVTGYVQHGLSLLPWTMGRTPDVVHPYVYAEAGYFYANELEYNDPTQAGTWADPRQLYYPRGHEEDVQPASCPRFVVMRNETWKLVYRVNGGGSTNELYNMVVDPQELTNLYDSSDTTVVSVKTGMLMEMLDWFVRTGDAVPNRYDSRIGPPSPAWPWAVEDEQAAAAGEGGGATGRGLRGA